MFRLFRTSFILIVPSQPYLSTARSICHPDGDDDDNDDDDDDVVADSIGLLPIVLDLAVAAPPVMREAAWGYNSCGIVCARQLHGYKSNTQEG